MCFAEFLTSMIDERCLPQVSDTDGEVIEPYRIDQVIEAGVCGRLVELLLHESGEVRLPAVRIVGHIVSGNDRQKQVRGARNGWAFLASSGVILPCMYTMVTSSSC